MDASETGDKQPMPKSDATQDFMNSLPELKAGESFKFACNTGVPCFNACCGDLNLMLTPYDSYRLRRNLSILSREFIQCFAQVSAMSGGGFPQVKLRMTDDARHSCPFVREAGCSVYSDRPGACRTYPLGRASRLDSNGNLEEQFFMVREDHCRGFEQEGTCTRESWLKDQGLEEYNEFNDRYMGLMSRCGKTGRALDSKQVNMAFLALYQPDDFKTFLQDMGILGRLNLSDGRRDEILGDEEVCLNFALEWLELVFLGGGNLKQEA